MHIDQKKFKAFEIHKTYFWVERALLLLISVAVRFPLMFIFFGSADMKNELPITRLIFEHCNGLFILPYPYFPLVGMFSWFSGFLTIVTNLPISFCYKLIPGIFDILLVFLVFDIVKKSVLPNKALLIGVVYALLPVPLLVNCIHFQWDSIVLFLLVFSFYIRDYFIPSFVTQFLFGLFLALSFFFKPYVAIFGLFFFTPYKNFFQKLRQPWPNEFKRYLSLQVVAIAGALFCAVVICIILHFLGFSIIGITDFILRYANKGAPQCGLPFAMPFSLYPLNVILKNRIWLLLPIGFIANRYYQKKLDSWSSILLSFMVVLGFAGIYAPYLQWPCVFFLLAQCYQVVSVYTFFAAIYLFLFCVHPLSNARFPYQNILSFAALHNFSWLMPSSFFTQDFFTVVLSVFGNYVIPLLCIGFVWYGLHKKKFVAQQIDKNEYFSVAKNGYVWILVCIFFSIGLCSLVVDSKNFATLFDSAVARKMTWYKTFEERRVW